MTVYVNAGSEGIGAGGRAIISVVTAGRDLRRGIALCMKGDNYLKDAMVDRLKPPRIRTHIPETPTAKGVFRYQQTATWCTVAEACEAGVLPEIILRRQHPFIPSRD